MRDAACCRDLVSEARGDLERLVVVAPLREPERFVRRYAVGGSCGQLVSAPVEFGAGVQAGTPRIEMESVEWGVGAMSNHY